MAVFASEVTGLRLPVRCGHPPQGDVSWAIVLDMPGMDHDPWVAPCGSRLGAAASGVARHAVRLLEELQAQGKSDVDLDALQDRLLNDHTDSGFLLIEQDRTEGMN